MNRPFKNAVHKTFLKKGVIPKYRYKLSNTNKKQ